MLVHADPGQTVRRRVLLHALYAGDRIGDNAADGGVRADGVEEVVLVVVVGVGGGFGGVVQNNVDGAESGCRCIGGIFVGG